MLGLVVVPLLAQYRGEVDVDAVVAPVTVRTAEGRVVTGVAASKFHLYVDGMEVIIRDLSPESDLPLSLGFILDTSGSMAGRKMQGCQQLIHAFLEERRREDQIALWTFGNERVLERFPFGMGWYLLPRVLETIRPWSTTAIYDMVERVPDVMERARHPRRAAILLTDGVDTASTIGYQEATRLAQHMQTPIYVLGVEPPPRKEGEGPSYEEILKIIADSSGGHYQRIPSTGDMPEVARTLLEELSSRYILSFATSGLGQHKWRPIEVTVEGYEATTRKGYMGTLP
jgi:Ca-activated chloride channel family protein